MISRITANQAWDGEADCLHCSLRDSVLFAGLTRADFEKLHEPIAQSTLAPGTLLYRAGDVGDALFTIRRGLIKQLKFLPDGTQRILRVSRSTDVIGLETLVLDTYQHDAIALQSTDLCRFSTKLIKQLSSKNPTLHKELMRRWQLALSHADAWILELSTGSAKARIARLLLHFASVDTANISHLVSREDMGAMLGITPETTSRIIANFKRNGFIKELNSEQCAINTEKLQEIAND